MEKKIGVYLCSGCGLGQALDLDALEGVARDEFKPASCLNHPFLCSREGAALIASDIEAGNCNAALICACSPRVMTDAFAFDVLVERVNLREQVAWCHPAGDEDTQMLAEDQLRMGLTRLAQTELPDPFVTEDSSRRILVVGGGLAGLSAALEASKAGYETVLVEKEEALGGYLKNVFKLPPTGPDYGEPKDPGLDAMLESLASRSNATVYCAAQVSKITGAPGMFEAHISRNGEEVVERVGAIVLAAGSVPYDPTRLGNLGFGAFPDVIAAGDLEAMFKAGNVVRPSNGQPVTSAAFILCAGSRDPGHLPYCSAACCVESLKQAAYFKKANRETPVYVFYKDMRSTGLSELFYKELQKTGVVFVRGTVSDVGDDGSGGLVVSAEDILTGSPVVSESVDLVVLATGMVPAAACGEPYGTRGPEEGQEAAPTDLILASGLLNLEYRQGPEIPSLKYGFPDSHFICFPYETRRTGIYAAGTVRAPMDFAAAATDGMGAAMKAIQCVEMVSRGMAVHPRSGDLSYPEFFMQRCTQCKRCTEECPFGAINEDEKANPLPNPTRCRRCGICMGACPERIISFRNYSVGMIGSVIKSIQVPDEYEEKPRILVLACENDAYPSLDMAGMRRLSYNAWVRIVPVRCLGSMNLVWIADALSKGIDGILLLGCKHGDDYQCHFIKGSELADIRMSKIQETLNRLVLESDRVRLEQVSIADWHRLPEILDGFAARVAELGPNPYKGF